MSVSKMAEALFDDELGGDSEVLVRPGAHAHGVDIVVGTPSKVLELIRGRGWDHDPEEQPRRKVNLGEPQMGLADVEWVVVDEADVLFGMCLFPPLLSCPFPLARSTICADPL